MKQETTDTIVEVQRKTRRQPQVADYGLQNNHFDAAPHNFFKKLQKTVHNAEDTLR